jgi:hypothetical protein
MPGNAFDYLRCFVQVQQTIFVLLWLAYFTYLNVFKADSFMLQNMPDYHSFLKLNNIHECICAILNVFSLHSGLGGPGKELEDLMAEKDGLDIDKEAILDF